MDWPGPELDGMDLDEDPPEDANLKRNAPPTGNDEEKVSEKPPRRKKKCTRRP